MAYYRHSIALHLLTVIFGFYIVVAILVTIVQLYKEYENTKLSFYHEIQTLPASFGKGISDSVWTYNKELLTSILQGVYNTPIVIGVKVKTLDQQMDQQIGTILDEQNNIAYFDRTGKPTQAKHTGMGSESLFSHRFPISHQGPGFDQPEALGYVTIYSNERLVFERVKYGFFLILINSVVKTLALWLIIYFFVRKYLGKPLEEFTKKIKHQDAKAPKPIDLKMPGAEQNEIFILKDSYNEMIHRLQEHQHALLNLNSELDQKVKERTQELQAAKEQAEALAHTDMLTQMNNRRAFFELGNVLVQNAIRNRAPLTIIMIDIDHFKKINDTFGHTAGDLILQTFAEVLLDQIRASDLAGRIGGEEFALLLPNTNEKGGVQLAEKIRQTLNHQTVEWEDQKIYFSACLGVAEIQPSIQSLDDLIVESDEALYTAKRQGRNRVVAQSDINK